MGRGFARRLVRLGIVIGLVLAWPSTAAAVIDGGCTASGTASSSGSIDLTNETVWHVRSSDTLSATGSSPVVMRSGSVSAYALGIAVPIRSETGNGDTTGSIDNVSVGMFASLGKVFVIAGSASGDGECEGQILVVLDDVDALFTLLGGGGLAVAIIGLAAILMASRSNGCLPQVLAGLFGGLGGVGLALSLEQFQVISPTTYLGLAIVIVGALLGLALAGRFAGGAPQPAPAAPTPEPSSTAPASTPTAPTPVPPPPVTPPAGTTGTEPDVLTEALKVHEQATTPIIGDHEAWKAFVNWPPGMDDAFLEAMKVCTIGFRPEDQSVLQCMRLKAADAWVMVEVPPDVAAGDSLAAEAGGELPPLTDEAVPRWAVLTGWPGWPDTAAELRTWLSKLKSMGFTPQQILDSTREEVANRIKRAKAP